MSKIVEPKISSKNDINVLNIRMDHLEKRMDKLENLSESINKLTINVEKMSASMENMVEVQKKQSEDIENLKLQPGEDAHKLKFEVVKAIILAVVGAIIGALLTLIIKK